MPELRTATILAHAMVKSGMKQLATAQMAHEADEHGLCASVLRSAELIPCRSNLAWRRHGTAMARGLK